MTEREIWGMKDIPKAGPLRWVPGKGPIIEIYDGNKIRGQLEAMEFRYAGRGIWEKMVAVKDPRTFYDELDRLGVYTATARKMHVYK